MKRQSIIGEMIALLYEKPYSRRYYAVLFLVVFVVFAWRYLPPPTQAIIDENSEFELRPISAENASAIFNTIQGALRSKNSQIEPIGVSFIPAYIPEGTLLYHGNANGKVPTRPEWIAMDHEFSYSFIADRGGPGGPGGRGDPGDKGPPTNGHEKPDRVGNSPATPNLHEDPGEGPGGPGGPGREQNSHPTLFTFRVVKPLNKMILLDGSSAAKTTTGEMDQQFILAGGDDSSDPHDGERQAADKICAWGSKFGLDGYIRIELGYEAVICDFSKLEVVNNVTLEWRNDTLGLPMKITGDLEDEFALFDSSVSSVASYDWVAMGNVHDKGEGRILLDYRGYQTLINQTYVGVDPYTRRIYNSSSEIQQRIIKNLENVLQKGTNPYKGTDWQLVTTEIIDKFSPSLKLINQTLSSDASDIDKAKNVTLWTTNFVRRFMSQNETLSLADRILEGKRAAINQYAHPYQKLQSAADVLIYSSIHEVTCMIVDHMFNAFWITRAMVAAHFKQESVDYSALQTLMTDIADLLAVLRWDSTYYRCSEVCNWDEVCLTPSWGPSPVGWNGHFGKSMGPDGRYRIDGDLQCVGYKTIMSLRG